MVSPTAPAVLIYPPSVAYFAGPPLGIAALAAALGDTGHAAAAWDVNAEFVTGLARDSARIDALERGLRTRLEALQARDTLDYDALERYRALVTALDTQIPLVRHFVASGALADDSKIVGDHDKSMPLIQLMNLARLESCCRPDGGFVDTFQTVPPVDRALAFAAAPDDSQWGRYAALELLPRILAVRPAMVGFSLIDDAQLLATLQLATLIKRAAPDIVTVVGGSYVTAIQDKLHHVAGHLAPVDAFARYEGETALTRLVDQLLSRPPDAEALRKIPNLAWRFDDYHWHALDLGRDPNTLPVPDFNGIDLGAYVRAEPRPTLPLITSKGCSYGKCAYCTYVFQEPISRAQDTDKIVADIRALRARHDVDSFSLKDSLIPAQRAAALAHAFIEADLGITWNFQSKISAGFTSEVTDLLAASGCRTVEFGVETINPRLQRLIRKRAPRRLIEAVLASFEGTGITVIFNMIYGFPGEREEEAEEALQWIADLPRRFPQLRFASVNHMLTMSRNAPFYDDPEHFGIELIAEEPLSAEAEWREAEWHDRIRRSIWSVVQTGDGKDRERITRALAESPRLPDNPRYPISAVTDALQRGRADVDELRLHHGITRAEAARRYTRWGPVLAAKFPGGIASTEALSAN